MSPVILENGRVVPSFTGVFRRERLAKSAAMWYSNTAKCLSKTATSCNRETIAWPSQVSQEQPQDYARTKSPVHLYDIPEGLKWW